MTLDKAIQIIKLNINQRTPKMPPDVLDALKLSVEAMERVQDSRSSGILHPGQLLPGETDV